CDNHIELSLAVRLMKIKSEGNITQRSIDQLFQIMRETHPKDNVIPKNSKTAQGKLNQASDCGGFGVSLHTSGSVTVPKHKAKM
ncbi:hypothetical protein HN51_041591, partial [Arachis hypogaea]